MVEILQESDREKPSLFSKRHKISEKTIYAWRKKFGAAGVDDERRLKQLEKGTRPASPAFPFAGA